jgi:hypothetical protein
MLKVNGEWRYEWWLARSRTASRFCSSGGKTT